MQKSNASQKLIILDSETGIATIFNYDGDGEDDDIMEFIESKGGNSTSCNWLVALEIEDNTK